MAFLRNSSRFSTIWFLNLGLFSLLVFLFAVIGRTKLSPKSLDSTPNQDILEKLLCEQDENAINQILSFPGFKLPAISNGEIYKPLMHPIQSACDQMKKIGGLWSDKGYDGGKYICLDDVYYSNHPCLIYSFGVGSEVSFEGIMSAQGCKIHAFDHTISRKLLRAFQNPDNNFFIHPKGIHTKDVDNMTTLHNLLTKYGHRDSTITYLKVDVEGMERELLLDWLESGILENVLQIGIEFHQVNQYRPTYFKIIQGLVKQGYKIISFEPNYSTSLSQGFFEFFEIVFRKVKTKCQFENKIS